MNHEKHSINWHTYSDHLREMLHEMMKSNELTDVTLVCNDKRQFRAHKIVLSACSSVFKGIVNDLPQNNSVIYLKGIQHQEMESILEFMYLGAATFYQERMNEFLNVAKNLEIKEISKNVEYDCLNVINKKEIPVQEENTDDVELQINIDSEKNASSAKSMEIIDASLLKRSSDGRFNCDQCKRKFTQKNSLTRHIENIHEGLKYPCHHCDHESKSQGSLTVHIQLKHEGVRYACNQCDHQFTQQANLTTHIKSKHEGVRYACNQCKHQASTKTNLTRHIQTKH